MTDKDDIELTFFIEWIFIIKNYSLKVWILDFL